MGKWDSSGSNHIGFKFGDLSRAARRQHTPESCWAAAMATASVLLNKHQWDNQLVWYQTARRAGLIQQGTTRIQPHDLRTLINGISGFRIILYNLPGLMTVIDKALENDAVALLMSANHVVVLGAMKMDKAFGTMEYQVVDPGNAQAATWSQADLNNFNPIDGAVITSS